MDDNLEFNYIEHVKDTLGKTLGVDACTLTTISKYFLRDVVDFIRTHDLADSMRFVDRNTLDSKVEMDKTLYKLSMDIAIKSLDTLVRSGINQMYESNLKSRVSGSNTSKGSTMTASSFNKNSFEVEGVSLGDLSDKVEEVSKEIDIPFFDSKEEPSKKDTSTSMEPDKEIDASDITEDTFTEIPKLGVDLDY